MHWEVDWKLVIGVIGPAVIAWLTVQLSLGRFYRERWWERRLAAYTAIIEALYDMRRLAAAQEDHLARTYSFPDDKDIDENIRNNGARGWEVMRRSIAAGDFLFSPAMRDALVGFDIDSEPDPNDGPVEECQAVIWAVDRLAPVAKRLAHKDLGLKPLIPWRELTRKRRPASGTA
jgi:hypothetical protein